MRERHAERFADYLRGGGGSQKLAASAGRGAGAAKVARGGFERDLPVRETGSGGLHLAGVFALFGEQGDAAGNQHAGQFVHGGQGHHHGGESFVAGGDPEGAAARRQGADQAAEYGGGVVAVGQGIEHPGGALAAAVAGVGAVRGEGDGAQRFEFLGGRVHQQADLPMSGMVAERDRGAIGGADSAVGAEDQKLFAAQRGRVPTHAGVLGPAESVAGGAFQQHFGRNGKRSGGAAGLGGNIEKGGVGRVQNAVEGSAHNPTIFDLGPPYRVFCNYRFHPAR